MLCLHSGSDNGEMKNTLLPTVMSPALFSERSFIVEWRVGGCVRRRICPHQFYISRTIRRVLQGFLLKFLRQGRNGVVNFAVPR